MTPAGDVTAELEWIAQHMHTVVMAVAAGRVMPAAAVMEFVSQTTADIAVQMAARGGGPMTERELGSTDVLDGLLGLVDGAALRDPDTS